MKCPNCHFENRSRAGFCGNCGVRLFNRCPWCDTESPAQNLFCDRCGCDLGEAVEASAVDCNPPRSYTPTSPADQVLTKRSRIEGERKVVTVLFADVADYTSMSERLDPEEVHQIMGGCYRILLGEIHAYEGTIDKFTGDGVMALFGAPLTQEDHARRACHAALAMRKAIGEYGESIERSWGMKFRMRIGLNSGTVVVAPVGDDLKMDYTVIGDTTNLASRMEGIALPGTILVSDQTYRLARDFFEFRPLGKLAVKGKGEPQEGYELVGTREVETRLQASAARGLTRFVGRTRELQTLREAFDKARSGSGQVVGIHGDAGVGKSRLLREFRNSLPDEEHRYLEGTCLHYGASVVYLPVLDVLRSYFDILSEDREESIQEKVRQGLARFDGRLAQALTPLQDVLSLTVRNEAYLHLDPQQRRERIFEAVRDLLVCASRRKPLVLAFEDLHWIDRTSQDFLEFLADGMSEAEILLLLLYRPEYAHAGRNKPGFRKIALDQLSTRRSAELFQAILADGEPEPEVRDLVLGKAGGNPLFVEELTASLLENGSIRRRNGRYVLAREASNSEVPETVLGIIAARMDRLEEGLKKTLQIASVIGREFACRILQTVSGTREELSDSLLDLQRLEFIHENQTFPELEYAFKHALTQEAAYQSLLLKQRRELHEETGRAMERIYGERLEEYYEVLAYHYVRSTNTAKAVEYLDLANRKTAGACAMEDAKGYFEKAMGLLDTLPDDEANRQRRISLLVVQDQVFFGLLRVGEYQAILARYEPIAASLSDQGLLGEFYAVLGYCELIFSHLDRAAETSARGARLCEAAGKKETAGYALYISALAHLFRADYGEAVTLAEEALRMTEGVSHPRTHLRASWVACIALARRGLFEEAIDHGRKALTAEGEMTSGSGWGGGALCYAYTQKRDLDRAIEVGESAVARAQTMVSKTMVQHILGLALCHAGREKEGIVLLEGLRQLFRATQMVMMEVPASLYLTEGYRLAGEYDKGRRTAEELLEIVEPCGARFCMGCAYFLLAEMSSEDEPSRAATLFEKSIRVLEEIRAENALAMAHAAYGRYHKRRGRVEQARSHLTRALETFERLGTLLEPDKARMELAELPLAGGQEPPRAREADRKTMKGV